MEKIKHVVLWLLMLFCVIIGTQIIKDKHCWRLFVAVNADKITRWKLDVAASVDMYNEWFIEFAPKTYRDTRSKTTEAVENALKWTDYLTNVKTSMLRQYPQILPMLRMTTAPPIARDRLIGLAGVSTNLIENMEVYKRLPPRMSDGTLEDQLRSIGQMIERLADNDIFNWLENKSTPNERDIYRAATIVADRLCGAETDPIVRNAQEQRQLQILGQWLQQRGYTQIVAGTGLKYTDMQPGTFSFRLNVPITLEDERKINIPVDTVIKPKNSSIGDFPLLIEAKSAGDFTNTNKRRKEEATKFFQLKRNYGNDVRFVLFLCGYFDTGYLGYEAAEGIDWVWEHRIDDLAEFGV